jgi:hypothetical protein
MTQSPSPADLGLVLSSNQAFLENKGQMGEGGGLYYARGDPISVAFGIGWFAYDLRGHLSGTLVRVDFDGANERLPRGDEPTNLVSNFIRGGDRDQWTQGVRAFGEVHYDDLWDGIDLWFYFRDEHLKYDLNVGPGADPSQLRFVVQGSDCMKTESVTGDLLINTIEGTIRDDAPLAYQSTSYHTAGIDVRFKVGPPDTYSFEVGAYDPGLPLVIDPGVEFSTLIGGLGYDGGEDLCIDGSGNILVTGYTSSTDFPSTPGSYNSTSNITPFNNRDAVVLRLSSDGSELLLSTFLGGNKYDMGDRILIGNDGSIYVAGRTTSLDFPTTEGALSSENGGSTDLFISKLDVNGSQLLYSTYFGGEYGETVKGITLDEVGRFHMTGGTWSGDLPVTDGAYCTTYNGNGDNYVLKLSQDLEHISYCTYIGGASADRPNDIAIDSEGRAVITGSTNSRDFPLTPEAFNYTSDWNRLNVFVLSLNVTGSSVVFSSVFGGRGSDEACGLALGPDDSINLVGIAGDIRGFPKTQGTYRTSNSENTDVFVIKMPSNASSLTLSSVFGGRNADGGTSIALDGNGSFIITGYTYGSGFPVSDNAANYGKTGSYDAFIAKLHPEGSFLMHSVLIGGKGSDRTMSMRLDEDAVIITGYTDGNEFSTTKGAYCATASGKTDIFIIRYELPGPDTTPPWVIESITTNPVRTGQFQKWYFRLADDSGIHNASIEWWWNDTGAHEWSSMSRLKGDPTDIKYWVWVKSYAIVPGTFHFRTHIMDISGNLNISNVTDLPMIDGYGPIVDSPYFLPYGTTGDPYRVEVNVTDNYGVEEVYAHYWTENPNSEVINYSLIPMNVTKTGNGSYELLTAPLPSAIKGRLRLTFFARDVDGNVCERHSYGISVLDNDPPSIDFVSNVVATTGDHFSFEAIVKDNMYISRVNVTFRYGSNSLDIETIDMTFFEVEGSADPLYVANPITVPTNFTGNLYFTISARDQNGNLCETEELTIEVVDNDPPWILDDLSDDEARTGEQFHCTYVVEDNIGIRQVLVTLITSENNQTPLAFFELEGVHITGKGNGTYSGELTIPKDLRGVLYYRIRIRDTSAIEERGPWVSVTVIDSIDPVIGMDLTEPLAKKGLPFTFMVEAWDNIGLKELSVTYEIDGGDEVIRFLSSKGDKWFTTIGIDRHGPDLLQYHYTAVDWDGNEVMTESTQVRMENPEPELRDILVWEIVEGKTTYLDLGPYLFDENDPLEAILVTCKHPQITVSGHFLRALYDEWEPDRWVEIQLSDGETTATASILVRVLNVNHPPSVHIVSFSDKATFLQGELIPLEAFYHDLDLEEGQELRMVWTSDLVGELLNVTVKGEVEKHIVSLPPGEHLISVTVDDGELEARDDVSIVVLDEHVPWGPEKDTRGNPIIALKDSPLALLLLVAIAIVIALIVLSFQRIEREEQ